MQGWLIIAIGIFAGHKPEQILKRLAAKSTRSSAEMLNKMVWGNVGMIQKVLHNHHDTAYIPF